MFYGEFDYKIDEKGRVPVPPKFRNFLKDGVVLTPGAERCITVYTVTEWKKLSSTLTNSPLSRSKMRKLSRALFATAFSTRIDQQGRIAIPAPLREHSQITDDVIVAGANTYLEIWDKALWEEEKAVSQEQAWQIIESLENNS
ncbi:MAG: division/cell wall cluster transcriptional repressor MraZ [Chloroflexi bacterium RBG_13_51_52]|nr:MAG: division/cell wall cluster transcriptional repressor MraZ [Chloroflexi bacterium RBG_13_51_52]